MALLTSPPFSASPCARLSADSESYGVAGRRIVPTCSLPSLQGRKAGEGCRHLTSILSFSSWTTQDLAPKTTPWSGDGKLRGCESNRTELLQIFPSCRGQTCIFAFIQQRCTELLLHPPHPPPPGAMAQCRAEGSGSQNA